jgi:hypothetical protein
MFQHQQYRLTDDEIYMRKLMTTYALNDCLSVTKLARHIPPPDQFTPPPTISYEDISEDEDEYLVYNDYEPSIQLFPDDDDI